MSTTVAPAGRGTRARPWGGDRHAAAGLPAVSAGRRRSVPHLALGALLVVACALGFAVTATSADHRKPVLALARPVSVGQTLTPADLKIVKIAAGPGVATVPTSEAASLVGRPAATSLPAGALLTASDVGGATALPVGQAIVAIAAKDGHFPPDLAPGAHVIPVVAAASTGGYPATPTLGATVATVTGVRRLGEGQGSVISLQTSSGQAQQIAALPSGQINLVVVPGGS